ncbi:MAG: DNA-processing protein DprA [bacterium]|nr:DNA-processing protein DprA [bacterium]
MDTEPIYLYILSCLPVKDISLIDSWRNKLGSFYKIYYATDQELIKLGWPNLLLTKWLQTKKDYDPQTILAQCAESDIQLLSYFSTNYPKLLRALHDPPPVLFYRGSPLSADEACIGIVGTRNISSYGKSIISKITAPLIQSKCTIVSGLACGVDAAAHQEAVNKQSRTIAVLGSGLDDHTIYPRHHVSLAHQILTHDGTLISEHPPLTPAFKQHFVARNRIIAGLSLGTIVVECKQKSGALITTDYTIDLGRPVFAVPGPIYSPTSEGPNNLIKQGAILITSGTDALKELQLQITQPTNIELTEVELRVLECMQSNPSTIDALSQTTHLGADEIMGIVSGLELSGVIRNLGAEGFIKV